MIVSLKKLKIRHINQQYAAGLLDWHECPAQAAGSKFSRRPAPNHLQKRQLVT